MVVRRIYREGPLLLAAFAAAYFLQGCADLDPIIKFPCQEAFAPLLTQAAIAASNYSANACYKEYQALKPRAVCVSDSSQFIQKATSSVMTRNVYACAEHVKLQLCGDTKSCETITPNKATELATVWAQIQGASGTEDLRKEVEANIANYVKQHYERAFHTRLIPDLLVSECKLEIEGKFRTEDTLPAKELVFVTCKTKIPEAEVQEIIKCNAEGQKKIVDAKDNSVKRYARQCGKTVLDELCPKKSDCAIDTSNLDLLKAIKAIRTHASVKSTQILHELVQTYMAAAERFVPTYAPHQLYDFREKFKYNEGYFVAGLCLLFALLAIAGVALHVRRRRKVADRHRRLAIEGIDQFELEPAFE